MKCSGLARTSQAGFSNTSLKDPPIVLSLKSHRRIGLRMLSGTLEENQIWGAATLLSSRFFPWTHQLTCLKIRRRQDESSIERCSMARIQAADSSGIAGIAGCCMLLRCEDGTVYDTGVANHFWLVIWNIWYHFFHILGISSSQLTFIFFRRGGSTTNQARHWPLDEVAEELLLPSCRERVMAFQESWEWHWTASPFQAKDKDNETWN